VRRNFATKRLTWGKESCGVDLQTLENNEGEHRKGTGDVDTEISGVRQGRQV